MRVLGAAISVLVLTASGAAASEAQRCHTLRLDPPVRIEACTRAMADPNAARSAQVNLLSARAMAFDDLGDYARALQDYDAALVLAPNDPYLHLNRGVARIHSGRPADAILDYDRAIQLKPDWHLPYFDRAVALYDLGRRAAALSDFERAIELKPTDAWIYVGQGDALAGSGDLVAARAAYDKALALRPELDDPRAKRANLLLRLDRPEEALAEFDRILARNDTKAATWLARGEAKFQLARFADAAADFRAAQARAPNNGDVRRDLTRALLANGDGEGAWRVIAPTLTSEARETRDFALGAQVALLTGRDGLALARRAAALKPGDGRIEAVLAIALSRAGDAKGAVEAAERAALFASTEPEVIAIARSLGVAPTGAVQVSTTTPAKAALARCLGALEAGDPSAALSAGANWSLCHLAAGG